MSAENIEARVLAVVQQQLGNERPPKVTDSFRTNLGCDSLDLVEMTMALEDEFCIVIDDDEGEKVATVADAIALVNKLNPS